MNFKQFLAEAVFKEQSLIDAIDKVIYDKVDKANNDINLELEDDNAGLDIISDNNKEVVFTFSYDYSAVDDSSGKYIDYSSFEGKGTYNISSKKIKLDGKIKIDGPLSKFLGKTL